MQLLDYTVLDDTSYNNDTHHDYRCVHHRARVKLLVFLWGIVADKGKWIAS